MDETGHWKEYLTYNNEWQGKNPFSVDIHIREHIEGCHWIQTKKIHRGFNPETGHPTAHYVKGQPKLVYTIPFSKENVNKILNDKHPFGEDSENVSEIALILFYAKLPGGTKPAIRCSGYTLEQFLTPWSEFEALARRNGGPTGTAPIFKYTDKDTPIK